MAEIVQKLGFDASQAITTLSSLATALTKANIALADFNKTAQSQSAKSLGKSLDNTTKKAKDLTLSFKSIARYAGFRILTASLTALSSAFRQSIKESVSFRLRIAEIQTIGKGLRQTNDEIADSVLRLSAELGVGQEIVAEGLYQVLSNQVVEAGEAMGFLEKAQKLAIITHGETKDAVNALSSVINSYGMEAGDAEHISGTLFKTVELGRLRLADIADILGRVTPLTAKMGVSWEEAASAIAVMTRQGVKADTALTQLRAVMQKIIKPTDKMLALFRRWGVKDGAEAIKTFGGLTGVLKKMAEETGGSSSEMADLFKRVRAIVGQMGIMTDEGRAMEETMAQITAATSSATDAFDEFVQTDAQQLTIAWQKLQATIIEFGTKVQPVLTFLIKETEDWAQRWGGRLTRLGQHLGILDKSLSSTAQNAADMAAVVAKTAKETEASIKGTSKAYNDSVLIARQNLAQLQREWNEYADAAVKANERVAGVFKLQSDRLTKTYENAFKGLENYLNKTKDLARKTQDALSDIGKKEEDKRFNRRLRNTKGAYAKEKLMRSRQFQLETKASQALQKGIQTEAQKTEALASTAAAMRIAEQAELAAEESGHFAKKNQAIADQNRLTRLQENLHKNMLKNSTATRKEAQGVMDNHVASAAAVKELTKDMQEQMKLLATAEDQDKGSIVSRIKALQKEMDKLQIGPAAAKFLDSLNIPHAIDEINKQLTDGLQVNLLVSGKSMDDIQKQFDDNVFDIKAKVDDKGYKALGKKLGVTQAPGEGGPQFATKVFQESQKVLKTNTKYQKEIEASTQVTAVAQDNLTRSIVAAANAKKTELEARREGRGGGGFGENLQLAERDAQAGVALNKKRNATTADLIGKITILSDKMAGNVALDEKELSILKQRITNQITLGNLSSEQATELQQAATQLGHIADSESKRIDALTAQSKLNIDAAEAVEKKYLAQGKALEIVKQDLLTVGANARSSVAGVNSLTSAMSKLADQAERAARAGAGGGGKSLYFGGSPKYYANGTPSRGQDQIPAMLSRGETVINSRNSQRFASELSAMNLGSQPVYREQGGTVTNVGDVNVTVNGGDSSQQTVREIGQQLRREIQRGTIKLR